MAAERDILSYFPKGYKPRDVQIEALRTVEANLDKADVFLINCPVAAGKTLISLTIAAYLSGQKKWKSAIGVPNNILLDQYTGEFPKLHSLRKKSSYSCEVYSKQTVQYSCEEHVKLTSTTTRRGLTKRGTYCSDCPYTSALRRTRVMPYGVYTYHAILANKLSSDALILDEAHNVIEFVKDLSAKVLWRKDYNYPHYIRSYQQLAHWVNGNPRVKADAKLALLREELFSNRVNCLVSRSVETYRGRDEECLKLLPVDVRNAPPYLWPSKTKKVFLLSATLGLKDLEDMGLSSRRICVINTRSAIEPERRPLTLDLRFNLSASSGDRDLPALIEYVQECLKTRTGRGFIHAPYSLALKLRAALSAEPRLFFHGRDDKSKVFEAWKESADGVLIASGFYEGVSLNHDMARWQLIVKLPWASLGEPALKYLAEQDPESYANGCARLIQQAYGRICRSPDDYGETIIVDKSFKRLYEEWPNLFAPWFQEVVKEEELVR